MKTIDEIKKDRRIEVMEENEHGACALMKLPSSKKPVLIIFSWALGWDHVSASRPNRCLTWEEMCEVKNAFFRPEECAVEYHPPKSDYINLHPYVLHLWRPQNHDFPMPPQIMV